jgi:uncharacterized membrane protein
MVDANSFLFMIRRLLYWVGYTARGRITLYNATLIGVAVSGVVLRSSSLGRSLWLDEAWVANSVSERSLAGMFYYDAWLQTSPPLFLLLVRVVVALFGLSNTVLRAVPAAMGILAVFIMLLFAQRILSRQFAMLAWVLLVFSPVAVNYSRQLKQYSAELAVTTTILLMCALYIENGTTRRFWLLATTAAAGLLNGYATAFLLPGIAFLIWISPVRHDTPSNPRAYLSSPFARVFLFTVITGGTLVGEYCLFVIPNSPEVIRTEWAMKNAGVESYAALAASESYQFIGELPLNHRFQQERFRLAAVGLTILLGLALAWLRFRRGSRKWLQIQVVCLLPCLLIIISDRFNWYPFTERTSLFALPCLIAVILSSMQLISFFVVKGRRDWIRPFVDAMVLCAIILTLIAGRNKNPRVLWPGEDMDGAVSFLHAHVQPDDFLWVHASCLEAFKLYTRMSKWQDAPARYGHTGWPCCPRGITVSEYTSSSEALVRSDFGNALPRNFSGRVWLLYTTRSEHWESFADEPHIMQTILLERGCTESPTPGFFNVGVNFFDCKEGAGNLIAVLPEAKAR